MKMDYSVLEKSALFSGLSAKALRNVLEDVSHHIQCYDKGETVFHLMEDANRIGVILEGRVQTQKPFPNGTQINVSVRNPGEMIGPAAVFSHRQKYPCDVVALEPVTIMMFRKEDILLLLQKDAQVLKNYMAELTALTKDKDSVSFSNTGSLGGASVYVPSITFTQGSTVAHRPGRASSPLWWDSPPQGRRRPAL